MNGFDGDKIKMRMGGFSSLPHHSETSERRLKLLNVKFPFAKVASSIYSYLCLMRSVGLKTLKNKLSEYIRVAAGGETVLVTDHDRVVAEIGPPSPARSSMLSDALLLDAFRQRWMTPPISIGRGPPPRKPVMTIDELLGHLQRDRADR